MADGGQKEVDFILERERLAYEVKTNLTGLRKSKYKEFIRQYPDFKFKFIFRENWLL